MSSLGVLTTTAEAVELDDEDAFFRIPDSPQSQGEVAECCVSSTGQENKASRCFFNNNDAPIGSKDSSLGQRFHSFGLISTSSSSSSLNETRSCTTTTDSWDEGMGSASEETICDIDVDSYFFGGVRGAQNSNLILNTFAKEFVPKTAPLIQEQKTLLLHAQNLFGSHLILQQRFDNHYLQQCDVAKPPNAKLLSAALAAPPMRQLPCKTWLATGSCGYGGRCVFLHDKRCAAVPVPIITKRKAREDNAQDAFFWPTLRKEAVCGQLDRKGLPLVSQPYIVPSPAQPELVSLCMKPPPAILEKSFTRHQFATHSVYEHFLDFLFVGTDGPVPPRTINPDTFDPKCATNTHMGHRKRLPIFVALSQGVSVFDTPLPPSAKDAGAKFGLRPGVGQTVASFARVIQLPPKKPSSSSLGREKNNDRGSRGLQEREREKHKATKRVSASSSSPPEGDVFSYSYWKD